MDVSGANGGAPLPGVPLGGSPFAVRPPMPFMPGAPMPMGMPMVPGMGAPVPLMMGMPAPSPMLQPMAGAAVVESISARRPPGLHPLASYGPRGDQAVVEQRLYDATHAAFMRSAERRAGLELAHALALDGDAHLRACVRMLDAQSQAAVRPLVLVDDADVNANANASVSADRGLHDLLALNHLALTRLSSAELLEAPLAPHHALVLATALAPSPQLIEKLRAHVAGGGLLITYNAAASVLAALASNVRVRSGASVSEKRMRVRAGGAHVDSEDAMDVSDESDADVALLRALSSLSSLVQTQRLVRLAGTQRLVIDASSSSSSASSTTSSSASLESLLVETAPSKTPLPLLSRVRIGVGSAYHLLPLASDDALRVRSAEATKALLASLEGAAAAHVSAETRRMWRTAAQCFDGALYHAVAARPFVEIVWALLHRHFAQHRLL